MAIVVKSKKIKEEVVDENGNVLGSISFNPEDTTTYTKLSDIMQNLTQLSDEKKSLEKVKDIPEEELKSVEEFEKYREHFNEINKSLHKFDKCIEDIKKSVDEIFGEGTCKIIMEDSNDIDMLVPLIEEVMPKFKNARKDKVSKYLPKDNNAQDVMN